ncbi:hypothetical protein B447_15806 [Thauera sp. 27]|uniref:hypothetical protein n=1 Tax=Thauera sp. 27 TaxID=305700 RepID=UPI0002CDFCB8|nr:hypothetical protein [Thauera sp. 27]ENO77402.1 hypothetical protein B447_15806 [Thauera sp. 27]
MTTRPDPVNILCLKWGTRYGAHYVNTLYRSVSRNLDRPFLFHCCTDDPTGLDPAIRIIPFPENPGVKRGWPDILVKLMVLQDGFGNLQGPTLFMDVDLIIMGKLDCFFDYKPGEYCIIHNWVSRRKELLGRRPAVGNSSVFRFDAGKSNEVYETFLREMAQAEDRRIFNTEQAFLTHAMKKVNWWPEEWVQSYKWNCRPIFPLNLFVTPKVAPDCRILVFHGRPDPAEAITGYSDGKPHHYIRPAPWLSKYWSEQG